MQLSVATEYWRNARPVVVSRGRYEGSDLVVVEVSGEAVAGRGECCPLSHYGQSPAASTAELHAIAHHLSAGLSRRDLLDVLPPGPARNGLDCALWDYEARAQGQSAWTLAGIAKPAQVATAMTLMMASPQEMAAAAAEHSEFANLKLKLGRDGAAEALLAVRRARPDAALSIDANEAWTIDELEALYPVFEACQVVMVEQPLRADADDALRRTRSPVPLCADESFHSSVDLPRCAERYDYVNIKLDKCGGLTEALRILDLAPAHGLKTMVGCMFATSLAIAPALLAAARADYADLDAPLHLASDRPDAFAIRQGAYDLATSSLWGEP